MKFNELVEGKIYDADGIETSFFKRIGDELYEYKDGEKEGQARFDKELDFTEQEVSTVASIVNDLLGNEIPPMFDSKDVENFTLLFVLNELGQDGRVMRYRGMDIILVEIEGLTVTILDTDSKKTIVLDDIKDIYDAEMTNNVIRVGE